MAKKFIKPRRIIKVPKNCFFCQQKKEPDFLAVEILEKYTSDRGKILGKDKTGICQKHQRRLTKALKRARHLALLPFISQ